MLRDSKLLPYPRGALRALAESIKDNNYRIFAQDDQIHLLAAGLHLVDDDPFRLFDRLMSEQVSSNVDAGHAFYLGYEMAKASIALLLGKAIRARRSTPLGPPDKEGRPAPHQTDQPAPKEQVSDDKRERSQTAGAGFGRNDSECNACLLSKVMARLRLKRSLTLRSGTRIRRCFLGARSLGARRGSTPFETKPDSNPVIPLDPPLLAFSHSQPIDCLMPFRCFAFATICLTVSSAFPAWLSRSRSRSDCARHHRPKDASRRNRPIGSRRNRAPICCSMLTIPSTGIRGETKRSKRRSAKTR